MCRYFSLLLTRDTESWYATHVQGEGEQVVGPGEFRIALGTCRQTINGGLGYAYDRATQTINAGVGYAYHRATQMINAGVGIACGPDVTVIDNR